MKRVLNTKRNMTRQIISLSAKIEASLYTLLFFAFNYTKITPIVIETQRTWRILHLKN